MIISTPQDIIGYERLLGDGSRFGIRLQYKIQKEHKTMIKENDIKKDLDSILDKINNEGFDSLSENEQERLYKGSQSLSRNKKKD